MVQELTARTAWIEKIQILGSRRYVENVSYGSDIDLRVYSDGQGSTEALRNAVHDPYLGRLTSRSSVPQKRRL
jgi:hypothetical protein